MDSTDRSFHEDADFEDSQTQGVELSATEVFCKLSGASPELVHQSVGGRVEQETEEVCGVGRA